MGEEGKGNYTSWWSSCDSGMRGVTQHFYSLDTRLFPIASVRKSFIRLFGLYITQVVISADLCTSSIFVLPFVV